MHSGGLLQACVTPLPHRAHLLAPIKATSSAVMGAMYVLNPGPHRWLRPPPVTSSMAVPVSVHGGRAAWAAALDAAARCNGCNAACQLILTVLAHLDITYVCAVNDARWDLQGETKQCTWAGASWRSQLMTHQTQWVTPNQRVHAPRYTLLKTVPTRQVGSPVLPTDSFTWGLRWPPASYVLTAGCSHRSR